MKLLLFSLSISSAITLCSQPVITSAVMAPYPDDSIHYYTQSALSFDPGPAGADVIWDFSGIAGDENHSVIFHTSNDCGEIETYQTEDTEEIGQIPNWWGLTFLPTSERGFTVDETSFSFCWVGGLEFRMIFDDPFTEFTFPLSYGLENMSLFAGLCDWGIYEIGEDDPFTGSAYMVVDGYGTLQLSTGIYSDVLRVKVIDSIGCDYGQVDSYYWFKEGYTGPLFKYTKDYNSGDEFVYLRLNGPVYLGVNENTFDVSVYPNPAGDYLIVDGFVLAVAEIYNLDGQIISTQQILNNQTSINISSLANGMYMIKLITSEGAGATIFEKF